MDRFLCADMLKDDCTCVLEGKLPQLSIWKAVSQLNWELGITFVSACTRMLFSPFFSFFLLCKGLIATEVWIFCGQTAMFCDLLLESSSDLGTGLFACMWISTGM